MTIEIITQNIIRWVNTCETWEHFDAIGMAVDNCLMTQKTRFGVDAVEEADQAISAAVTSRIKAIGLRSNGEQEVDTDTDSAFEGNPVRGTDSINYSTTNCRL